MSLNKAACFSVLFSFCPICVTPALSRLFARLRQVLVPLVLLQALQTEGKPLTTLLQLGLRCLEEDEAPFITQQGGWVRVQPPMHLLISYL